MPTATMTSKGQVTIPVEVREALNLKPGDRIDLFRDRAGIFVLSPRASSIRDLEGCVPSWIMSRQSRNSTRRLPPLPRRVI